MKAEAPISDDEEPLEAGTPRPISGLRRGDILQTAAAVVSSERGDPPDCRKKRAPIIAEVFNRAVPFERVGCLD